MAETSINCPHCGKEINVNEILYHKLEEEIKHNYELKEQEFEAKFKESIEKSIREKVLNENAEQLNTLEKELNEKSQQLIDLNKTKAENERLKREKNELREQITFEKEKEFNAMLLDEKQKIKSQSDDENSFKIKELEKKLTDQSQLIDEMKRKAEQGSVQLQGEVQELAIEDILRASFPFDLIEEVSKGVRGADVVHTVRNLIGTECGKILYESKRTKSFSNDWISKLKSDASLVKADILVIVSEALPNESKISLIDGVWVCSFTDLKGLVIVLRESLVKINEANSFQVNKGEKMQMLYDYLTSNEFKLQVSAIVDGFSDLQENYLRERRAMERIWKEREKQLEKVLLNTNHFIGAIKGIAGNSMNGLKEISSGHELLELPPSEN